MFSQQAIGRHVSLNCATSSAREPRVARAILAGAAQISRRTFAMFAAALLFVSASSLAASIPARAAEFRIEAGAGDNLVKFQSKAPMESFDGKTKSVSGTIVLDPDAIGDSVSIAIDVDVSTFDTGLQLRNQHMRENHLHCEKYPMSTFRGGKVVKGAGSRVGANESCTIVVDGLFELHGVARAMQIPITLRRASTPAGALQVDASFDVKLADHEIPRPQMLFMKLGESQRVVVSLLATPAPAEGAEAPPETP
jgi:polyisoprenoid-binding protein YceI